MTPTEKSLGNRQLDNFLNYDLSMKILTFFCLFMIASSSYSQEVKEPFWDRMARYHDIIMFLAQGSLDSRGLTLDSLFKPNVPSYDQVAKSINKQINNSTNMAITSDTYEEVFAATVKSQLSKAK